MIRRSIFILFFICGSQLLTSQVVKDTLIVGYAVAPPFIIEDKGNLEGINVWLWQQITEDLNIEFKLVPFEFPSLLNALETGQIDVCINPLTITSERSEKMEFTHSYYASNSTIATPARSSFQKFFLHLKSFFNVGFLKGFLILSSIIGLFGFLTWYFERKVNSVQFRPGWIGIFDGLWWSVVTMTTVGYGDKFPKTQGGKTVALIWMFSGLLFVSGLTASVASSLTVNKLNNTSQAYIEYKNRKIGTIKNSSTSDFLKDNFFKKVKLYDDLEAGLKELEKSKIEAFLYDEPILKYRIRKDEKFNNLNVLPIKFNLQFYAFGLPKNNFELEQILSQKLLEITESHEWRVVLNEYGLGGI